MNKWTIDAKDNRTIYNFNTDHIKASMYEMKNVPRNKYGDRKMHFYATTSLSNEQIDEYFWAHDIKDAKNRAKDILYAKMREHIKLTETIKTEITNYM